MYLFRRHLFLVWIPGILLPLSGVGQSITVTPEDAPVVITSPAPTLIGAKDLVLIKVFREEDLQSTLRVSEDGTVAFPLIGKVEIQHKTPQEAAGIIRTLLMDGYLRNPQVTVTVMEHFKRRFTVLGQVQKPGSYDIPDQDSVTLLQAIGIGGGFTSIANQSKILIKRKVGERERLYKLNGKDMAKGSADSSFVIQPGDVISVSESWL